MKWHLPSEEERALAAKLLQRYLAENLRLLNQHADQAQTLSREVLQRTLSHTLDCVLGAGALLPPWEETVLPISNSNVTLLLPIHFSHPSARTWQICFADGQHIRLTVAHTVRSFSFIFSRLHAGQAGLTNLWGFCWLQVSKLVRHLLESGSDDTKALFSCISIHQMLLFYHGVLKDDFETHQKNFQMVKKVLGCNLVGRKMAIRALLIDRVQLQHELRVLESAFTLSVITSTAQTILQDLIRLATSHYSEVRSRAQAVLGQFYRQSPLAYQVVVEDLMSGLQSNATPEQLKGTPMAYFE